MKVTHNSTGPARVAGQFLLAAVLWLASGSGRAQTLPGMGSATEAERIRNLEERIAALEQTVSQLLEQNTALRTSASAPAEPPERVDFLPPVTQPKRYGYEPPPELVPEIGKIGAQIGVTLAGATSPFRLNKGPYAGGYIDLPLLDKPDRLRGKLSYEISVGLSQSKTTFPTTSNVAQVANLVVLDTLNPSGGMQNLTQAINGTGAAPFPVVSSTQTRLRLLQVVPFALKYTSNRFDRWRLRPYGVLGFGIYVTIHNQNPALGNSPNNGVRQDANLPPDLLGLVNQLFGGQAPFGGPLVAGQISQSPELEARGLPGGHGNIDIGLHTGAGLEFRVNKSLAIGFDARYNRIAGTYGRFLVMGSRIGIYF